MQSSYRMVPAALPMSSAEIERTARTFIMSTYPHLAKAATPFPITEFIEFKMRQAIGFDYSVEWLEPATEAITDVESKTIILSESTYEAISDNVPRARFTAAHEIGHAILHSHIGQCGADENESIQLFRRDSLPAYVDPEWQANKFAAAILMPQNHMSFLIAQGGSVVDVCNLFLVSHQAAAIRINELRASTR